LAQSDLDDKQEKSFLNYIKFDSKEISQELTIATTRPELL